MAVTDAVGPPAPPPAQVIVGWAPPPKRRRRARPVTRVLVAVAVLASGAYAGQLWRTRGPDHPSEWDSRVSELVTFVERERGLAFSHPVHVDFLAEEAFRTAATDPGDQPQDPDALVRQTGALRALGLASGDVDLAAATETLLGEGVLGYYDHVADRLVVRGTELTPAVRVTLAHELTHVLQDQHHDLSRLGQPGGAGMAYRALVEADAERIEAAYVDQLIDADRLLLDASQRQEAVEVDLGGVPPVLTQMFSFPYVFGPAWLTTVLVDAGDDGAGLVAAFGRPPVSSEQVVLADRWAAGDVVTPVELPALDEGEVALEDAADFGMLELLLVLSGTLGYDAARTAATGWAGDVTVTYRDAGGTTCVRVATAVDTPVDRDELLFAATAWADAAPDAEAHLAGDLVVLDTCDPGPTAPPRRAPAGPPAFDALAARAGLLREVRAVPGATMAAAACQVDRTFEVFGTARLLEVLSAGAPDPDLVAALRTAGSDCA